MVITLKETTDLTKLLESGDKVLVIFGTEKLENFDYAVRSCESFIRSMLGDSYHFYRVDIDESPYIASEQDIRENLVVRIYEGTKILMELKDEDAADHSTLFDMLSHLT